MWIEGWNMDFTQDVSKESVFSDLECHAEVRAYIEEIEK